MRELARALGKYQAPAFYVDTSALVKTGHNDYGVISAAIQAYEHIEQKFGHDAEPDIIIPMRAGDEYALMYVRGDTTDDGIPKPSIEVLFSLDLKELPPEIRYRRGNVRDLWRTTSQKAARGGHLDIADLDLLTFLDDEALNARTCFVFAYDEDIISTAKKLASQYPNIHIAEESLQTADKIAKRIVADEAKPLLVPRRLLGELYDLGPQNHLTHYILIARVPIAGKIEEMAVSIHPLEREFKPEQGDVSRYVLDIAEVGEMTMTGYKSNMMRDRRMKQYLRAIGALARKHSSMSSLDILKSKNDGFLSIKQRRVNTDLLRGGKTGDHIDRQWLMVENRYLQRFSPETLEAMEEIKSKYPK